MAADIELVVFDLGRVLIRICDDWSEACNRAGVQWSQAFRERMANPEMADLAHRHDTGELDLAAFSEAAGFILKMPPADLRAASPYYLHHTFAGAGQLIDDLNAGGVATACLSNTNETHWRIMSDPSHAAHVPLHRLRHRFASHLIGTRKPDPAVYEFVERKTGVAPESILFFDDVSDNVIAARKRNWNACEVDPTLGNPIPAIREKLGQYGVID